MYLLYGLRVLFITRMHSLRMKRSSIQSRISNYTIIQSSLLQLRTTSRMLKQRNKREDYFLFSHSITFICGNDLRARYLPIFVVRPDVFLTRRNLSKIQRTFCEKIIRCLSILNFSIVVLKLKHVAGSSSISDSTIEFHLASGSYNFHQGFAYVCRSSTLEK